MKIELSKKGKYKGQFEAIVDDSSFDSLNKLNWSIRKDKDGYNYAVYTGKGKPIYMHRMILGNPKDKFIDHINGNRLDNRKENLRVVTNAQNQMNAKTRKHSSIYKGVSWQTREKSWVVKVYIKCKRIIVGYFKSEIEAAKAYDVKAKEIYGEFALTNFL